MARDGINEYLQFITLMVCIVLVRGEEEEEGNGVPVWVIVIIVLLVVLIIVGIVIIILRRRYVNMKKRESETKYAAYSKFTRRSVTVNEKPSETLNKTDNNTNNNKNKMKDPKGVDVVKAEQVPLLAPGDKNHHDTLAAGTGGSKTKYKERYFILKEIR